MDNLEGQFPEKEISKFRYRGPSMGSTFSPGQVLHTQPKKDEIRPGDVVVYRTGTEFIVHRVIAVKSEGIQTRGDDNRLEDGAIRFENIIGVVKEVETSDGIQPVVGGFWGHQLARLRWAWRAMLDRIHPSLGIPYRWIKSSGLVSRFWHPCITVLRLQTGPSVVIKYIVRGKTVATWEPDLSRFTCRRPYDLIISPPITFS